MNKAELVAAIAEKTSLTKKDADAAVQAFIEVVAEELKKEEKVAIMGFGTFEGSERKARTGVDPRTKEPIEIAASKSPKFKAGKTLRDAVR